MAQRNIRPSEIRYAIETGKIINEYPDDTPHPSKLLLGFVDLRPVHIVFSELEDMIIIISAYEPDPKIWNADFTRRKT